MPFLLSEQHRQSIKTLDSNQEKSPPNYYNGSPIPVSEEAEQILQTAGVLVLCM